MFLFIAHMQYYLQTEYYGNLLMNIANNIGMKTFKHRSTEQT